MYKAYQPRVSACMDSYKLGHADQYPEGTSFVFSNFTPRSFSNFVKGHGVSPKGCVWFGLQAVRLKLNEMWKSTFFDVPLHDIVEEFREVTAPFCGTKGFDLQRIVDLHNLGYLPIAIDSLPEGTIVPAGVPCMTVYNTDKNFAWLTNFLETWLSCELWKACNSATLSYCYREIIEEYSRLTGCDMSFVQWQGHDFSVRGMSGMHDAAISGAGHLLSFTGSDNVPATQLLRDCYGATGLIGSSIPATEHSVMCAGGKESELDTFRRLIKLYPSGNFSVVSDTWDFWKVIGEYAPALHAEIMSRGDDAFGCHKMVFRPDSGDPVNIICGDPNGKSLAERKGAVQVLWDNFGGTTNEKGFKTLDDHVGLIYGDSITLSRCEEILSRLHSYGFAANNIVFGIGSYTFQYNTRDSLGFAMKSTFVKVAGEHRAIFKEPKTDSVGFKTSAKGLLSVQMENGQLTLKDNLSEEEWRDSISHDLLRFQPAVTLADIRNRLYPS